MEVLPIQNQVKGIMRRLSHLSDEIKNTSNGHVTSEEKIKLLNDIKRLSMIKEQVRDLEVNETRFSNYRKDNSSIEN